MRIGGVNLAPASTQLGCVGNQLQRVRQPLFGGRPTVRLTFKRQVAERVTFVIAQKLVEVTGFVLWSFTLAPSLFSILRYREQVQMKMRILDTQRRQQNVFRVVMHLQNPHDVSQRNVNPSKHLGGRRPRTGI